MNLEYLIVDKFGPQICRDSSGVKGIFSNTDKKGEAEW